MWFKLVFMLGYRKFDREKKKFFPIFYYTLGNEVPLLIIRF